jgi:hypothetical protein
MTVNPAQDVVILPEPKSETQDDGTEVDISDLD